MLTFLNENFDFSFSDVNLRSLDLILEFILHVCVFYKNILKIYKKLQGHFLFPVED